MDELGRRIIHDQAEIRLKLMEAEALEKRAKLLRHEAAEAERLLQLAREAHG